MRVNPELWVNPLPTRVNLAFLTSENLTSMYDSYSFRSVALGPFEPPLASPQTL